MKKRKTKKRKSADEALSELITDNAAMAEAARSEARDGFKMSRGLLEVSRTQDAADNSIMADVLLSWAEATGRVARAYDSAVEIHARLDRQLRAALQVTRTPDKKGS